MESYVLSLKSLEKQNETTRKTRQTSIGIESRMKVEIEMSKRPKDLLLDRLANC